MIGPAEIEEMMAERAEARSGSHAEAEAAAPLPSWPVPTDRTTRAATSSFPLWFWSPLALGSADEQA